MIEYVDYLMSFENNKQNENLSLQNVFSLQQKRQLLKYLWELTKLLQKNISHEKQKYLSNIKYSSAVQRQVEMLDKKSYEQIMPSQKLLNRIVVIISDIKNYINPYYGNLAQIPHHIKYRDEHTIFKVINFRDHIFMIIS